MSFKKILVAINNSPLNLHVFTAAIELAQANQAAFKLFHCIPPEMLSEPAVPMSYDPNLQPSFTLSNYQTQQIIMEQQMEAAEALLERYRQEALNQGVPMEVDYQVGEAGHLVCEVAKNWEADLIVVGRRGRSGLAEVLLGSVSNYVVHHAPCSVLVIQELESQTTEQSAAEFLSEETQPPSSDQR
jgi:nucleotide-binding universal stress UspA family protein